MSLSVNEARSFFNDVLSMFEEMKTKLTTTEKTVCNCYHILELDNLDAITITKVTQVLREALKQRRIIKNELRYWQSFSHVSKDAVKRFCNIDNEVKEDLSRYEGESRRALEALNTPR
jgi:hypothetical protein